jgi:hypothetical protein
MRGLVTPRGATRWPGRGYAATKTIVPAKCGTRQERAKDRGGDSKMAKKKAAKKKAAKKGGKKKK